MSAETEEEAIEKRLAFGQSVREAVSHVAKWLEDLPTEPDERSKFVVTWEHTLVLLAWDVSDAALALAANGSVRAGRMLNRSLAEYAYRAHHFVSSPAEAQKEGAQAAAMARKIMSPTRNFQGEMSDEAYDAFKAYLDAGTTDVQYGKVVKMMNSTLNSMGLKAKDFAEFRQWLEVEYTLGSGLIHGSVVAILDAFQIKNGRVEKGERSLHFKRCDELTRTSASLILLIAAVEKFHDRDFGGRGLVQRMESEFFGKPRTISVWQHDAQLPLLGVKRF